ncbi:MAG: hypothetical protein KR126chlam2_00169 [Chlamydiae bacterium]|nr:hypothetical protein [Chlamydiota bacterium]
MLLYKAARKVDSAANPVVRGWKTDLKIHMISKPAWECGCCMIPFAGNLAALIARIGRGLNDHLMTAVCRSNTEVVKLARANGHLDDSKRAESVLGQAAYSSNLETFNLILDSRVWNQFHVIRALPDVASDDGDKIANRILDYYKSKGFEEKGLLHFDIVIARFKVFVKAERGATADRILAILPTCCEFGRLSELLQNNAFVYRKSYGPAQGTLTEGQIGRILGHCVPPSVQEFQDYCKKIHSKANELKSDIENSNTAKKYLEAAEYSLAIEITDADQIVRDFYVVHSRIVGKILERLEFNGDNLIQTLALLSNNGQLQFLELFLREYDNKLSLDDRFKVLEGTIPPSRWLYPNSNEGLLFLLRRFIVWIPQDDRYIEFRDLSARLRSAAGI